MQFKCAMQTVLVLIFLIFGVSGAYADSCFTKPTKGECLTCCFDAMQNIGFFDPSPQDVISTGGHFACIAACSFYYDDVPEGCPGVTSSAGCAKGCQDFKSCNDCCDHFNPFILPSGCKVACQFEKLTRAMENSSPTP